MTAPYFEVETTRPEDGSFLPQIIACRKLTLYGEDRPPILTCQEYVRDGFERTNEAGDYAVPIECVHRIKVVR